MPKIIHICVGGPYTDGFTYQENILSKHHSLLGYEVTLIASPLCYVKGSQVGEAPLGRYKNEEGVTVIRLPFARPKALSVKLKRVKGLYQQLEQELPDIIFLHGIQTMASSDVARYLSRHNNVRLYVDNHVDESNMGGSLHRLIIDETIWRREGRKLIPYASAFYGVLPARVRTLSEVYKIPANCCELLVMGYDDKLEKDHLRSATEQIESWLYDNRISGNDILLCTGGKIDSHKTETWSLLHFIAEGNLPSNMKLVLFGSVESEREEELLDLCAASNQIHFFGWADKYQLSVLISKSDVGIYLGRHSVLWEQTAGEGIPLIIRTIKGYEHLDRDGNVWCIGDLVDSAALKQMVLHLQDSSALAKQQSAAISAASSFRYSTIARKSLQVEKNR